MTTHRLTPFVLSRRTLLLNFVALATLAGLAPPTGAANDKETAKKAEAIRPFEIHVPPEALDDLKHRITATRWPDQETVADQSQGVQLARLQELVQYWGSGYDWRNAEAKLNALPQFMTNIAGVAIHFIHF